jgi:SpoVK/Ycf46/Vps4 family AAA+-type ATPase
LCLPGVIFFLIQEVEFLKKGFLSSKELDAIVSSLSIAGGIDQGIEERTGARQAEKEAEGVPESSGDGSIERGTFDGSTSRSGWRYPAPSGPSKLSKERLPERLPGTAKTKTLEGLEAMGVKIYGLENNGVLEGEHVSWDNIAGYYDQKREIEDMVLLALKRPEVYDSIARGTRRRFESNRPRAILFEGPPGDCTLP